jgi:hypothetical protein
LLFNKRRISEVQELKIIDYLKAEKNDEPDDNILNSLEMSDRILSQWYVHSITNYKCNKCCT